MTDSPTALVRRALNLTDEEFAQLSDQQRARLTSKDMTKCAMVVIRVQDSMRHYAERVVPSPLDFIETTICEAEGDVVELIDLIDEGFDQAKIRVLGVGVVKHLNRLDPIAIGHSQRALALEERRREVIEEVAQRCFGFTAVQAHNAVNTHRQAL